MADRLTGKASYFVYNGIQVPITKASRAVSRKMADTTDNGDYLAQQDLLTPTQLAVNVTHKFEIEGRYRKSVNPTLSALSNQSSVGGLQVTFGHDTSTLAGTGLFDMTDYKEDTPVDDVVTYTASLVSNGLFSPN